MKIKRKSIQKFLSDLVQLCVINEVEFKMLNKSKVLVSGMPCNGYFEADEKTGKLVVASNKPQKEWLPILVHESCHLDQWLENKTKFLKDDGIEIIDKWLLGNKVSIKSLDKAFEASKKLELDCEKRSVEKIKKYNLPIEIEDYIQKSNTYVYFYNWVRDNRKWVTGNKSLYIKEIYKKAPKEFQKNYKETPIELAEAFNKYL